MKRKTFYYISLSLPYVALVFSGALAFFLHKIGINLDSASGLVGIVPGLIISFLVSAVIWGPLYTWMVVVMLFWGKGKRADEVRNMYLCAPVLLGLSMGMPAVIVDPRGSALLFTWGFLRIFNLQFLIQALFKDYSVENSLTIGLVWALMAAMCLVIGYMFVGIVLLIERALKKWKFFREEEASGEPLQR